MAPQTTWHRLGITTESTYREFVAARQLLLSNRYKVAQHGKRFVVIEPGSMIERGGDYSMVIHLANQVQRHGVN